MYNDHVRAKRKQNSVFLNSSIPTLLGKYISKGKKNRKLGKKMLGHNYSIFYEGLAKFLFSYWSLHFEFIFFVYIRLV